MDKRITDWKNKLLSFAGRLQLIVSVLSSIHVYWASVFILPKTIIKELENKMKRFLWGGDDRSRCRAKVAWKSVCLPKCEGGLGIRKIQDVNRSLMAYHMFSILSKRDSLWTNWVSFYRLKQRSLWDIPLQNSTPWGWKKLLQCRDVLRPFFWNKLGNGQNTFLWYDTWCNECPLSNYVTPRQMASQGLGIYSKVADVIVNGCWDWPEAWRNMFPVLFQLSSINISESNQDSIMWRNLEGKVVQFTTREVWNTIRDREQNVSWSKIVWSPFNIPKHAFNLWLIFKRSLWTQDRILHWNQKITGSMNQMCCLLCFAGLETHEHLFFECKYSNVVWKNICHKIDMDLVQGKWEDIVDGLMPRASSRSIIAVASRLVVAALAYNIWRERNLRLFYNRLRPPEQVTEIIISEVRVKLALFKYKASSRVKRFLKEWKLDVKDLCDETD